MTSYAILKGFNNALGTGKGQEGVRTEHAVVPRVEPTPRVGRRVSRGAYRRALAWVVTCSKYGLFFIGHLVLSEYAVMILQHLIPRQTNEKRVLRRKRETTGGRGSFFVFFTWQVFFCHVDGFWSETCLGDACSAGAGQFARKIQFHIYAVPLHMHGLPRPFAAGVVSSFTVIVSTSIFVA
jgi:hypothetical protein